nr:hypothetical protein CFP56_20186 [Quercus suber]
MEVSDLITRTENTWIDACLELPPNQYDTKNTSSVLIGKLITYKAIGTSVVSDVVNKAWRPVYPIQEALVHPRRTPSLKAMESFPQMARDTLHIINILGTSAWPSRAVEIFEQPPTTQRKS